MSRHRLCHRLLPGLLPGLFGPLLLALAAGAPALGQEGRVELPFELTHGQRVAYEVELTAYWPGQISIVANWPGNRRVMLKLAPVRSRRAVLTGREIRRTGPSPVDLSLDIPEASPERPEVWKLEIRAIPARGGGSGTVLIDLPTEPAPEPIVTTPQPPAFVAPDVEPEEEAAEWPADLPAAWGAWQQRTESFRVQSPRRDACRWQDAFVEQQPLWASNPSSLDVGSQRMFATLIELIDRVEVVRTTDDPVIAGPPPADPERADAWSKLREKQLRGLVGDLDRLLLAFERHDGRGLSDPEWPHHLVTCVMACERHFVDRGRVGAEQAINYELANAQWERIREAARTLEAALQVVP